MYYKASYVVLCFGSYAKLCDCDCLMSDTRTSQEHGLCSNQITKGRMIRRIYVGFALIFNVEFWSSGRGHIANLLVMKKKRVGGRGFFME